MKPDFICIGAHRAGTTWLYHQFKNHPEFAMPPIKEIHYFDRTEKYPSTNILSRTKLRSRLKNMGWVRYSLKTMFRHALVRDFSAVNWYLQWYFSNYTDEWYSSLFNFAKDKLTGDITPGYSMLDEDDVYQMRVVAGNPKIVFIIRNPVERAWSMLRFDSISWGYDLNLSNIEYIKKIINSPAQELRSDYRRTIDLYCRYFDSSQILIGFYDAISRDPAGLMTGILNHIGSEDKTPGPKEIHNKFNFSRTFDIPHNIREYLVQKYHKLIEYLSSRFGSYTNEWLDDINGTHAKLAVNTGHLSPVAYL